MSYDLNSVIPFDVAKITYSGDEEKPIRVWFDCPRCGTTTATDITGEALLEGFSVSCDNSRCVGEGERPGYILVFSIRVEEKYLSLLDRPLHAIGK